jgi:hypothetical protein
MEAIETQKKDEVLSGNFGDFNVILKPNGTYQIMDCDFEQHVATLTGPWSIDQLEATVRMYSVGVMHGKVYGAREKEREIQRVLGIQG